MVSDLGIFNGFSFLEAEGPSLEQFIDLQFMGVEVADDTWFKSIDLHLSALSFPEFEIWIYCIGLHDFFLF